MLAGLSLLPLLAIAYYGDYRQSEITPGQILLIIILIVWGILNIILFFKIWGMTNDVKEIKSSCKNSVTDNTYGTLALNYFIKKELYGKESAVDYLKKRIEKKYQELGALPTTEAINSCKDKLTKKLSPILEDAKITLPALSEYDKYKQTIYGDFVPGTKVKVKGGSAEVCTVCRITDENKIVIKNYAGYIYEYNADELILVKE